MQKIWAVPFVLALAACTAPAEPEQPAPSGVGFGSYSDYLKQLDEQSQVRKSTVLPPPAVSEESTASVPAKVASAPKPAPKPATAPKPVAQTAAAAAAQASDNPLPEQAPPPVPDNSPLVEPGVEASSIWDTPITQPAQQAPAGSDQVTDDNNFSRVTSERTRRQDAERLQRNREQYVIIEPTELPKRPGTNIPNIVAYAVATTNPVGVPLYKRGPFDNTAASDRACARYVSADLAQEAFLSAGGPKKDPKKLDPDGDGFACKWDPTVFRSVKR